MRFLFTLAALGAVTVASAQTSFRLVDPVLSVDGARLTTAGAPLLQEPFGILTIGVPGDGTYTVSERPFAGARRAGQFDGDGLYFAANGRSVRLRSGEPILSLSGPASAYVRYEPARVGGSRGVARLTVADDVAGRGRRSVAEPRAVARPSGPRPSRGAQPGRPAASNAEVARLRGELDRLVADRQRLAAERDRLLTERDAARRPTADRTSSWATRNTADRRELAAVIADRDRLDAERRRLQTERAQLADALARVQAERDRLAADFGALRQRAEDAEARSAASGRTDGRVAGLQAELAAVRADLASRDRALDLLRDEQADRQGRLPSVEAALADARRQLAEATAARDRALADRDAAYQQRDDAYLARDAAAAEADALRAERREPFVGPDDLRAERVALARDRALLDADRAALAAERDAFESLRASGSGALDLDERAELLDRLAAAQAEREALVAERDRLALELDALRSDRRPTVSTPSPTPAPPPTSQTVRTPVEASDGAVAYLPGFDFGRLENPDVVRRRLDEAQYPRWATVGRIEGDVLVLFQTDPTGRVIRTAVPQPLGGGLDGLAEEIVREMRFTPPVVAGQPTGLRSQVTVRFER